MVCTLGSICDTAVNHFNKNGRSLVSSFDVQVNVKKFKRQEYYKIIFKYYKVPQEEEKEAVPVSPIWAFSGV